jgi:hypothetical protein
MWQTQPPQAMGALGSQGMIKWTLAGSVPPVGLSPPGSTYPQGDPLMTVPKNSHPRGITPGAIAEL